MTGDLIPDQNHVAMGDHLGAPHPAAGISEMDAERLRAPGQARDLPAAMGRGPVGALLALQRAAGNAAVAQLLQAQRTSTARSAVVYRAGAFPVAPAPATPGPADREVDESRRAAEARAAEAFADGRAPVVDEPPVDDPEREHSAEERAQKEAEGEGVTETDAFAPTEGGPAPVAEAAGGGPGFVDDGCRGSVPFSDALAADLDPERDAAPHAFVNGGMTGLKDWAGGGGRGPKGNQPAGSIQKQVPPVYESSSGGPVSNADAWVNPETGTVTVKRSYLTSSYGDQANGWWVSRGAAVALDAHERKHVKASQQLYETNIEPVLDKIVRSVDIGKGKFYLASNAKEYLKGQIGWEPGLKKFQETDKEDNAPGGTVDQADLASSKYPHERPPAGGTVNGKHYDHRLMLDEEPEPQ